MRHRPTQPSARRTQSYWEGAGIGDGDDEEADHPVAQPPSTAPAALTRSTRGGKAKASLAVLATGRITKAQG